MLIQKGLLQSTSGAYTVFALTIEDPGFDPQTKKVLLDTEHNEGQKLYQPKHENQFAVTHEEDIP